MSFRQFGGLQFGSKHNAVASYYNTSNNLLVTQNVGQSNSYINFLSDISGNISIYGTIPIGGIILWSGSIISIPLNWSLCNGTNGTPNLTDRFIIGAGATYPVGTTGGSSLITLTNNELPSHTHDISLNYITASVSGGGDNRVTSVGGAPPSSDPAATGTSTATGAGNAFSILPPYYALCYIMRTV